MGAIFSEVDERNLLVPVNAQLFSAIFAGDKLSSHEFRLSIRKIAFSISEHKSRTAAFNAK